MISVVSWYLSITLLGLLTFPLVYRLLPGMPDRGYSASRALGLILWGYIFWLLASLGILRNSLVGILFALAVLGGLSIYALRGIPRQDLKTWWRDHQGAVLVGELLFVSVFVGYALVRSYMPEAIGTEKPMELAFINAILKSPTFPPRDPWLAGYGISYYYFGYVIVAMLAKLTATAGSVAFNMGIISIFSLSALGAYGLVYSLLKAYQSKEDSAGLRQSMIKFAALLGPLFLLIISNLEGFLHSLHNRGLFWRQDESGNWISPFWHWLDIKDLNLPPSTPFSWVPERFWWWWRASRVLQDYDLAGGPKEIIDEFPFFSYLLADLHPHVLAMPFGLLAITLSLNLILGESRPSLTVFSWSVKRKYLVWGAILFIVFSLGLLVISSQVVTLPLSLISAILIFIALLILIILRKELINEGLLQIARGDYGVIQIGRKLMISPSSFILAAIVLGGMFFMNAWDFPVYLALFCTAYALGLLLKGHKSITTIIPDFFWMGITLGICGVLFYLPFYMSFSSQAGGPLPNLIFPTRGAHLWIMFATLLLPIFSYLIYIITLQNDRSALLNGFRYSFGFGILLFVMVLLFGFMIVLLPGLGDFYQGFLGSPDKSALFSASIIRRLTSPGGWITLITLLALALAVFIGWNKQRAVNSEDIENQPITAIQTSPPISKANLFVVLLILLGILVVLGPEFFYLRDQFGWRMNTIFKFYFQAWQFWSLAAAFCSIILWNRLRGGWRVVFRVSLLLVLAAGMFYPILSIANKTNGFQVSERSLDSSAYLKREDADSWEAIRWLETAPSGIIAEAVPATGGSYTPYARMATHTGEPNLLGWVGHESQWRGGGEEMGDRKADLARLYCTRHWNEAQSILEKYDIRYIVVGPLEHSAYQPDPGYCPAGLMEIKFINNLDPVFQAGGITIYEYKGN